MQQSAIPFFVIQSPNRVLFFDVRSGAWVRDLEAVPHFRSYYFAAANALEWDLVGKAVVTQYRIIPNARPQPADEDME